MSRTGRFLAVFAALALGAALGFAGCSPKSTLRPNVPPETYVFIQGAVDTVSHRIHLYWYGTDPDGDVVGYEMRMISGQNPNPAWTRLTCGPGLACTDSLFTVQGGDSAVVSPVFQFRAVDDDGAVDESPAQQQFLLSNLAPLVQITNKFGPADTTFASATVHWSTNDPDGGGPGLRYYIWLNGQTTPDSTTEQTFTMPSARFLQAGAGGPEYLSGYRTLYLQARDDGGRLGPVDSTRWYVRAPALLQRSNRGRILLVDDVPVLGANNATFDGFYTGGLTGVSGRLLADSGRVLRPEFQASSFRSARDFAQTLRQFETVVWYRGYETSVSSMLRTYQDSLMAWVADGGRLFLDGPYLVAGALTVGALREEFVSSHLGSDRLLLAFNGQLQDSTAGWSNRSNSRFRSSRYAGLMTSTGTVPGIPSVPPGLRAFQVRDTADVALWAISGQLEPPNDGDVPVGVSVPFPSGGRVILLGIPIRNAAPATATPLFRNMVRDLLLP